VIGLMTCSLLRLMQLSLRCLNKFCIHRSASDKDESWRHDHGILLRGNSTLKILTKYKSMGAPKLLMQINNNSSHMFLLTMIPLFSGCYALH
jgi:hypothetical protein